MRPALDRSAPTLLTTSYKSLQLAPMARLLGADHIAYASCLPLFYPESALLQVLRADISEADRDAILGSNALRFLGLGEEANAC